MSRAHSNASERSIRSRSPQANPTPRGSANASIPENTDRQLAESIVKSAKSTPRVSAGANSSENLELSPESPGASKKSARNSQLAEENEQKEPVSATKSQKIQSRTSNVSKRKGSLASRKSNPASNYEKAGKLHLGRVKYCGQLDESIREDICEVLIENKISSITLEKMDNNQLELLVANYPADLLESVQTLIAFWRKNDETKETRKSLVEAIKHGEIAFFETLLNSSGESNFIYPDGYYCEDGDISRDVELCTLLHIAAKYNRVDIATFLLDFSAKRNDGDFDLLLATNFPRGENALHYSSLHNSLDMAKFLVDHSKRSLLYKASQDDTNQQAIHFAASGNACDVIQALLLEYRVDLFAKCNMPQENKTGLSALHVAVMKNQMNAAKLLAKWRKCALQNEPDADGDLPLHYAIKNANKDLVHALCDRFRGDIDLDTYNKLSGRNALHEAVLLSDISIAKVLVESYKAKVDSKTLPTGRADCQGQQTPLHLAVEVGNLPMAEALVVEMKAQVNLKDSPAANTPLHLAVRHKNVEVIKLLLSEQCGPAKTEARNSAGRTPFLLAAAEHGDAAIGQLLIESNARCLAKSLEQDFDQATALHLACFHKHFEFADFFLEKLLRHAETAASDKFEDLMRNSKGENALQFCTRTNALEAIAYLLSNDKAKKLFAIDSQCPKTGRSALHTAAVQDNVAAVEMLLQQGANLHLPSRYDSTANDLEFTPFLLAVEHGAIRVFNHLIQHCETVLEDDSFDLLNVKSPANKCSLLHAAVKGGRAEMCRHLIDTARKQSRMEQVVNCKGFLGRSPLHFAAVYDQLEIAAVLIANGAKLEQKSSIDDHRRTALHLGAISSARQNSVLELLLEAGANREACDFNQNTPLHLACLAGNYENAKTLIKLGANVKAIGYNGCSPLHSASVWTGSVGPPGALSSKGTKHLLFVEMLSSETKAIEAPSPNDVINCKFVPLAGKAAYDDKLTCAQLLVYQLPELATSFYDRNGNLPVHLAAMTSNVQILKFLCKEFDHRKRPMREAKGAGGLTPFQLAAKLHQQYSMELLVDMGTNINSKSEQNLGRTVLPLLVTSDQQAAGPDLKATTAAGTADNAKQLATINFLLNTGADYETADDNGDRTLHLCVKHRNLEMTKLLLQKHPATLKDGCCLFATNILEGASVLHLVFAIPAGRLAIKFFETLVNFYQAHQGLSRTVEWLESTVSNNKLSNEVHFQPGNSCLHIASSSGNHRLVTHALAWLRKQSKEDRIMDLLLAKNHLGRTALHCAAVQGNLHCVRFLLQEHCALLKEKNRNMIQNNDITLQAMILSDMTDFAFETPFTLASKRLEHLLQRREDRIHAVPAIDLTVAELVDELDEDPFAEEEDIIEDDELTSLGDGLLAPSVREKIISTKTGTTPSTKGAKEEGASIGPGNEVKSQFDGATSIKRVTFSRAVEMREIESTFPQDGAGDDIDDTLIGKLTRTEERHIRRKLKNVVDFLGIQAQSRAETRPDDSHSSDAKSPPSKYILSAKSK